MIHKSLLQVCSVIVKLQAPIILCIHYNNCLVDTFWGKLLTLMYHIVVDIQWPVQARGYPKLDC